MSLCGGLTENNNILGTVLESKIIRADVPTDELGTVLKRSIRWSRILNRHKDRDAFNAKIISFEDFNSNPMKYVTNPLLVGKC